MTIFQLREACNHLSPSMLFSCETKNREKVVENIRKKLNFENSSIVESINRSGGIALMWNKDIKAIEVLQTAFTIEAHLIDQNK